MVLESLELDQLKLIIDTVHSCIISDDRFNIVRGLEILSGLSQVKVNSEILTENIQDSIYEHIVNLLCVHDIQLIVYTLECLYHLSDMGEEASTKLALVAPSIGMYKD